jgi:hypothetical protein
MAVSLIFTKPLEITSNGAAGNGKSAGQPQFPDVQSHFHENEG